jgi:hypothetical protein
LRHCAGPIREDLAIRRDLLDQQHCQFPPGVTRYREKELPLQFAEHCEAGKNYVPIRAQRDISTIWLQIALIARGGAAKRSAYTWC